MRCMTLTLTKGGADMVVTPPPAQAWEMRGAKQPREKYLMTNKHKSEYGKVWWISLKYPVATNFCYFCCQII